jgi:hypothetical protein
VLLTIAWSGLFIAKTQVNYVVFTDGFPCAIVLRTSDSFYCKPVDLSKKIFFNELYFHKIDELQDHPISNLPIGPLTPIEIKRISFDFYNDKGH